MKMTVASEFMHRLMLVAALSMTGCTAVGPDYVAPAVTTPAEWNAKLEAGLTTARDVDQARLNLEQTRAQIPTLRTGIEQAGHRIAILLGQNPGTLAAEWVRSKAIPTIAADVTVGVPADALRRRPDVRRAERQLAAQTAQIGVATAALYPSFRWLGRSDWRR